MHTQHISHHLNANRTLLATAKVRIRQLLRRIQTRWYPQLIAIMVLLFVSSWYLIPLTVQSVFSARPGIQTGTDAEIITVLNDLSRGRFTAYSIIGSDRLFAVASGLPGFERMVVSSSLLSTFNRDERMYVIAHEVGHVLRHHTLREAALVVALASILWSISTRLRLWQKPRRTMFGISMSLGLLSGLFLIQLQRLHEYEADMFALEQGVSPEAMIAATKRFAQQAGASTTDDSLIRTLFVRGVPYSERIRMAESALPPTLPSDRTAQ